MEKTQEADADAVKTPMLGWWHWPEMDSDEIGNSLSGKK